MTTVIDVKQSWTQVVRKSNELEIDLEVSLSTEAKALPEGC